MFQTVDVRFHRVMPVAQRSEASLLLTFLLWLVRRPRLGIITSGM